MSYAQKMQANVLTPTVKLLKERQMFIVLQINGVRQIQVHQDAGIHQLHLKLHVNTVKTQTATLRSVMKTHISLIVFQLSVPSQKTKIKMDVPNQHLLKIACGMENVPMLSARIHQLPARIHHV
jgi:hypothetical protein